MLFIVLVLHLWAAIFVSSPLAGLAYIPLTPGPAAPAPIYVSAQNPDTPTVWRITFRSQAELSELTALTDPWEVNFAQAYVLTPLLPAQVELFAHKYQLIPDSEATARLASLFAIRAAGLSNQTSGIPGFACYRTVEETYSDLANLAQRYPNLANWIDIGDSWSRVNDTGGYDLNVIVLTNRAVAGPKFRFFLMAAIHARELTTSETATRFAETLLEGYGVDPDITWLLDYGEVHILPVANPDGRKLAEGLSSWRKNTNSSSGACLGGVAPFSYGIDLNRNSSYQWNGCEFGGCSSADPCSAVYRGESAASEPETQAIENYLSTIFDPDFALGTAKSLVDTQLSASTTGVSQRTSFAADNGSGLFISLHSYGQWVLFPWGYTGSPTPDDSALRTLGRKFGFLTDYQVCQSGAPGCLYPTDGTTDDWVYGNLGITAYTLELGTWFFQSCNDFEQSIVDPALDTLLLAFKAAHNPLTSPAGPDVTNITMDREVIAPGQPLTLTVSADDTRYDSNGYGEEPSQPIRAIRVSTGERPWSSHGAMTLTLPFTQSLPQASATLRFDDTPVLLGRHLIFFQAMDMDGNSGLPTARFLTVAHPSLRATLSSSLAQGATARPGQAVTFTVDITYTASVTPAHVVHEVTMSSDWTITSDILRANSSAEPDCRTVSADRRDSTLRWQIEISGVLSTCRLSFTISLLSQLASPAATVTFTTTEQSHPDLPITHTFTTYVTPTALHLTNVSVLPTAPRMTSIIWQISDPVNTWGFHVWRASSVDRSAAIRLSAAPLLASTGIHLFEFQDLGSRLGGKQMYWIEEITLFGESVYHGPFTATQPAAQIRYLPMIMIGK